MFGFKNTKGRGLSPSTLSRKFYLAVEDQTLDSNVIVARYSVAAYPAPVTPFWEATSPPPALSGAA